MEGISNHFVIFSGFISTLFLTPSPVCDSGNEQAAEQSKRQSNCQAN